MNEGGFSATASSAIFYDPNLRAGGFDEVKFVHCPREANMAAHEVARSVSLISEACTLVDEPPSFLLPWLDRISCIFDSQTIK